MLRQAAQGARQIRKARAHAIPHGTGSWPVAHIKKEGDHKDRVPDRRKRPDDPGVGLCRRVQPEKRRQPRHGAPIRAALKQGDHRDQRQHPARIAKGPAIAGNAPPLIRVGVQLGQVGIGKDRCELHPDQADAEKEQRPKQREIRRGRPPQRARADHIHGREEPDPRHPPPRGIRHSAQNRGQHRNRDARQRQTIAPVCLRLGFGGAKLHPAFDQRIGRGLSKVGAEDESQNQGVVRLAGPVKEIPSPDALAPACLCHVAPFRGLPFFKLEQGRAQGASVSKGGGEAEEGGQLRPKAALPQRGPGPRPASAAKGGAHRRGSIRPPSPAPQAKLAAVPSLAGPFPAGSGRCDP